MVKKRVWLPYHRFRAALIADNQAKKTGLISGMVNLVLVCSAIATTHAPYVTTKVYLFIYLCI